MTYDALVEGLKARGFVGIDKIDSMGECHKDEKHYVLLTDGLVIYSTIPFWKNVKYFPDEIEKSWSLEKWNEDIINEFNWEEFDEAMKIRYEEK